MIEDCKLRDFRYRNLMLFALANVVASNRDGSQDLVVNAASALHELKK